jgi:hypothetical protein
MPTISNIALVEALRQTKLISQPRLERVCKTMRKRLIDAPTLAQMILKQEWITPYQMKQLLEGNGHGLVVGPYHVLDLLGQGGRSTV